MADPRDINPADMPTAVEPATADTVQPEVPASASNAPAVPLAGVPVTPIPEAGIASTGPAVPSTDHMDEAAPTVAEKDERVMAGDQGAADTRGPYPHRD